MIEDGRYYLVSSAKFLKLDLSIPYSEILNEAKSLRNEFIEYRSSGEDFKGWHSLPIYGLDHTKPYSHEAYGFSNPIDAIKLMGWTEVSKKCPVTVNWLKNSFPSKILGRTRFMLLEPGGQIGWHTDTEFSILENVNISLSNHPDCKWYWKDGSSIDFTPGNAYAVNISYPHKVINNSNEDRYHIIIHHHDSTPEWFDMMNKALKESNEQGNFVFSKDAY
jgi:Aspartyl/Asparaginyl beta-hydroxylase